MTSRPTTMMDAFLARVAVAPDAPCLVSAGRTLSFRDVEAQARGVAGALRAEGVAKGDRVVLMLPNVPQFVAALYGVFLLGAVAVPTNPLLREREIAHIVRDARPVAVIAWFSAAAELAAALGPEPSIPVLVVAPPGADVQGRLLSSAASAATPFAAVTTSEPEASAAFLYTSGTTGFPKGAMISHRALIAGAVAYGNAFKLAAGDRQIAFLPLFHSFGLTAVLNASLLEGASVVLVPRFVPGDAVAAIADNRVTVLTAVTAMHAAILTASEQARPRPTFEALRLAGAGAATFPPDVARRAAEIYGCPVVQGYGLTETTAAACLTHPTNTIALGLIGAPLTGVEMRIARVDDGSEAETDEVGEIQIRGSTLMTGYYGNAAATRETILVDGWLRTGDLGKRTPAGYVFVDRLKELIKRGGFNVYPSEVEAVLYEHPDVKLAAVIGVPDERLGEEVAALVVRRSPEPIDTGALVEWVKARVAPYKYPRRILEVDDLPRAPTGKVLKREIDRDHLFPPLTV